MARKKKEVCEIELNHCYSYNGYMLTFVRIPADNIIVKAVTNKGGWYIKQVSIEDIRTLLDIDPNVKIVIKED